MSTTKGAIGAGRWSIETVRAIVTHHQHAKVAGTRCDSTTAGMICAVYDALNEKNRASFLSLPFPKAVQVGWKLCK